MADPRPDDLADAAVAETATRLRYAYCLHRRLWEARQGGLASNYGDGPIPYVDGGRDQHGRTYKPVWERFARWTLARGLDPLDYVRCQFATAGSEPPHPGHMMAAEALDAYARTHAEDRAKAEDSFRSQSQLYGHSLRRAVAIGRRLGWTARQVLRQAAGDPDFDLTPLYRHCALLQPPEPDPEGAAPYRDAALLQYLTSPDGYEAVWGGFVPAAVRRQAAALRAELEASVGGVRPGPAPGPGVRRRAAPPPADPRHVDLGD